MRVAWVEASSVDGAAASVRAMGSSLAEVSAEVAQIVADVRERGDEAVRELTARLDGTEIPPGETRVDSDLIAAARASADPALVAALETARSNIAAVAEAQLADDRDISLEQGQTVTVRQLPVGSAGVYVPGGRAAYPSSVLMCCVPAQVAGVRRIAVASPPDGGGSVSDSVLVACAVAGIDEVHAIGGAQAIAALAHGTAGVMAVDVIAGPGNRYVQEAKRIVAGTVGIDGIAGPSELMVVVDASTELEWAALDLCAQAEHGDDGLVIAVSDDREVLASLERTVAEVASSHPGVGDPPFALVALSDPDQAVELAELVAPEHLQLMCEGAAEIARRITTAGCVLIGNSSATAFGDYVAGSNHVLPTGGAGRHTGPLGPGTFTRALSIVSVGRDPAAALAPPLATIARAEGFPVHAESAEARVK